MASTRVVYVVFAAGGTQDTPERVTIFVDVKNRPADGRFFTSMAQVPPEAGAI